MDGSRKNGFVPWTRDNLTTPLVATNVNLTFQQPRSTLIVFLVEIWSTRYFILFPYTTASNKKVEE